LFPEVTIKGVSILSESTRKRLEFIINTAFVALVLTLVYVAVKYALGFIMPFIIALIVVAAFRPISKAINKRVKISKGILSVILTLILYLAVAAVVVWLTFRLIALVKGALNVVPSFYQTAVAPTLSNVVTYAEDMLRLAPVEWGIDFDVLRNDLMTGAYNMALSVSQQGASIITGATRSLPMTLMNVLFTVVLSFFVSIYYDDMMSFFRNQLSEKAFAFVSETRVIFVDTVFKYIKAYIILMLVTFTELSIGLTILRTPRAIAVGAVVALFDAMPFFGTGGVMVPWAIIEFIAGDYSYAIGLIVLYAMVTIVRNIIEPKVVGDQLGINPILSLMAIYLGFRLLGLPGMIMFPITVQIFIALHKKGRIKLYKSDNGKK
jgi:sporulation integral membrane protein YtvI